MELSRCSTKPLTFTGRFTADSRAPTDNPLPVQLLPLFARDPRYSRPDMSTYANFTPSSPSPFYLRCHLASATVGVIANAVRTPSAAPLPSAAQPIQRISALTHRMHPQYQTVTQSNNLAPPLQMKAFAKPRAPKLHNSGVVGTNCKRGYRCGQGILAELLTFL